MTWGMVLFLSIVLILRAVGMTLYMVVVAGKVMGVVARHRLYMSNIVEGVNSVRLNTTLIESKFNGLDNLHRTEYEVRVG